MSGILLGAKPNILKPSTARSYGASWAGRSSTQFSRLGSAVAFSDPTPGVGATDGSSPFDDIYPWCDMEEYNVIDDEIAYKKGVDSDFSRVNYDTVVKLPKSWYKISMTGTEWQVNIASGPMAGYSVYPLFDDCDEAYVGRYICGSGYVSRSATSPLVSVTRTAFRSGARSKGAHWYMYEFLAWAYVLILYLIEYADWNSQSVIGQGYTSGSAAITTGGTDSMTYHTGCPAGTDGKVSIQYRNIEDFWGNIWQWLDGINFNGTQAWYCTDRSNYGDDKSTGYTKCTFNCPSGSGAFPTANGLDANAPWLILPSAVGGSNASYIPDGWWTDSGWRAFSVGGAYNSGLDAGVAARTANAAASSTSAARGGRLLYIPSQAAA